MKMEMLFFFWGLQTLGFLLSLVSSSVNLIDHTTWDKKISQNAHFCPKKSNPVLGFGGILKSFVCFSK
jgi:hypothetical protein